MKWDFRHELDEWGPDGRQTGPASPQFAREYCRNLARTHYENFPVVTRLLPEELHQHFFNVYAFCRWSDDLGDEIGDPARSRELLGWWSRELAGCYAGDVRHPVFVALRETVSEFDIPRRPFDDLISAFDQDQVKTRYETFDELRDYCRRSADPVGRIVLYLMRSATDENFVYADSVCTGLQLANFWQDVRRDDAIGRKYLPAEDCRRFGYSDEEFSLKESTESFRKLLRFEVGRAREFLEAGRPLVGRLPRAFQMDMELFIRGGLCILKRIEKIGYCVWERRPKVTKGDLVRLFVTSWLRQLGRRCGLIRHRPSNTPNPAERISA